MSISRKARTSVLFSLRNIMISYQKSYKAKIMREILLIHEETFLENIEDYICSQLDSVKA